MLVGVMVGDPISLTVLKHVYHFETGILFKGLQNNFYKKRFGWGALTPPLPSIQMSILFFDNKFGWGEDPPFQTMSKIS